MNTAVFVCMMFCLQFFYWLIGKRASGAVKDEQDYFLAGKDVRLFPLMMTFLATQVGGGLVLGAADEAYRFGWPVLLYPLGCALGLILLGSGLGRKLASFRVSTVAEILEVVYGSGALKKAASLLSIVTMFMILVAQIIASHKFLVSLGVDSSLLFVLFWATVIIYTAQGGMRAVISTDIVQAAFFCGVFALCFVLVVAFEPAVSTIQFPTVGQFAAVSSKLCGWLLMPLLFMVIEQDMGQRCFAGRSPGVVSRASLLAGMVAMVICVVPVFLGTLANSAGIVIPEGGSTLMAAIMGMTNPWVAAIVACAVLAAVISTATSLINAISSNLASDFQLARFQGNGSLSAVKWMTCLISVGAIFLAFYFNNIVDLLIQSYELSVCCLFIPVIAALFKRKGNFSAALLAMLFGTAGFVIFRIYPIAFPKEIASIALSFFGFGCGTLLARIKEARQAA